ncbi:MAG: TetR/AcrR family transcriptional regulator [Actinomycetota bacterium]
MRKPEHGPLTRDDWTRAALETIGRGGVSAVAVETIAAELGATKGSFYWHFKNRTELIEAALDRWEERRTDAIIQVLEQISDPAMRLRTVMEGGIETGPTDRAEIALLANPGHPAAIRAVRRVAKRRIAYMAKQLEALGYDPQDALDRAVLISYVYVGHLQIAHLWPRFVAADARRRRVQLLYDALVGGNRKNLSRRSVAPGAGRGKRVRS